MQDDAKRKISGFSLGAMLPVLGVSLTWFCCVPIAAGALGAGAATIGVALTPLCPYLGVLAMALLSLAFLHTTDLEMTAGISTRFFRIHARRLCAQQGRHSRLSGHLDPGRAAGTVLTELTVAEMAQVARGFCSKEED